MVRVLARRDVAVAAVIIVICAVVSAMSPQFLTVNNLINIATGSVVLALLALGMSFVLIPAHIDVSVAAQLAVVSMIVGQIAVQFSDANLFVNPVTLAVISIAIGAALGLLNGVLVAVVGLPAIIVTLGTASVLRGLLFFTTNGQWISGVPAWLTDLQVEGPFGVPWVIVIVVVVAVAAWMFMRATRFGREILAAGGNREAALRMGVRTVRVDMAVFVLMGGMAGLAGMLYVSRMGSAQPGAAVGLELSAIAAAVLGGASVFGGRIQIGGVLLGVLLLGVIENGLVLTRVPVYWQTLVSGLIVVVAVTLAVVQETAAAKRRASAQGPASKVSVKGQAEQ